MSAAPEDARPAPGTPVRPSASGKSAPATTTVVTPTKVGPDEWRRDGVGGHTPEDFYSQAAELKGAPSTQRGAGVGVVGLTHSSAPGRGELLRPGRGFEGRRARGADAAREGRRAPSMEREFREILPHTSIGKRRAGWEAPVYWKDKDPESASAGRERRLGRGRAVRGGGRRAARGRRGAAQA